MNLVINLNCQINKTYFLLGLFCGLYVLRLYNISLVFFSLFIIFVFNIIKFLQSFKISVNMMLFYYSFVIISLLSSLIYGYNMFVHNFINLEFFKILIFIFMSIFIKIKKDNIEYFFKGLKITIFINLIWGLLESISWKLYRFWLNEYIFGDMLKIDSGGHGWRYIRGIDKIGLCGFSWDPLHLGILSALGFFLFKKKSLKVFSLIILLLGGSRAGLLGLIGSIIFFEVLKNFNLKNKKYFFKGLIKNVILFLLGLIFVVGFFKFRIAHNNMGDKRRKAYYISAIKSTVIKNNIGLFLFGGSPVWSGAILTLDKNLSKSTYLSQEMIDKIYWKIESDWAHILTGRGWIGFFSYIWIFYLSFFKIKDEKMKKIILLFFFSGLGYYFENSLIINIILIYINQNYRIKFGGKNERNNISRRKWNKTLSNNKINIKTDNANI